MHVIQSVGLQTDAIYAEQVHGNRIAIADEQSAQRVSGVDGLVSSKRSVAIMMADCVPVLLVDPRKRVWAAVHAGWKGTLKNIVRQAVLTMRKLGAQAEDLYGVIGPHIGACCYDVPEERIKRFQKRFGQDEKMAFRSCGTWHLDVGWMNYRQLIESGVSAGHIDAPPTCTHCQYHEFFSFRSNPGKPTKEMMAVIGWRSL